MNEHQRFLELFDALFVANNKWMEVTPAAKLEWVPLENPNMKFGDRISTINIKSLYVHTLVGECGWSRMLGTCKNGAALAPDHEQVRKLTQQLDESRDLLGDAMRLHGTNMERFKAYDQSCLDKKISWMGRDWSVMGFLWGIYSHRSYHLGNIDLLVREADAPAPDFFTNFRQVMA
ncbi:MAG TPA: hypothetical protein VIA19_00610 [Burkholderiales bacterium]|jgi:hypothetical protein